MSLAHTIHLSKDIIIGAGILSDVGKICRNRRFNGPILVITGQNVHRVAGERLVGVLEDSRYKVDCDFAGEPTEAEIERVQRRVRKQRAETLIGIGGGRVIDVAKLAASRTSIPFISIPTAASHDGIGSPYSSIHNGKNHTSIKGEAPDMIFSDLEVIRKAPYRLLAAGCGDIVAKYTAVLDWRLAHRLKGEYYGEYAASLALMSAKLVTAEADSIARVFDDGIRVVMEALISCGVAMCIAGSSRPCSGSEHLFSHSLDRLGDTSSLHGEQTGVGAIMMCYLHGRDWRKLKHTLQKIGAPTNARELGVPDEMIVKALMNAHKIRTDRYTILGESGLSQAAATQVAKETEVIQ